VIPIVASIAIARSTSFFVVDENDTLFADTSGATCTNAGDTKLIQQDIKIRRRVAIPILAQEDSHDLVRLQS